MWRQLARDQYIENIIDYFVIFVIDYFKID